MATASEQPPVLTVGDVARHFGVPTWKVRRLYERGLLPPPVRAGLYRLVSADGLVEVEAALKRAGYLPAEAEAVASVLGQEASAACN
jgi:DNA-binding transcriptional MerR regulator